MARVTKQLSIKECYEILQLKKGADLQTVKAAYRRRAFELHPDLHPGNAEASRQFQLLNEAYVALSAMLKPVEEARQKAEAQKEEEQKKREGTGEKANYDEANQENRTSGQDTFKDNARARQAYAEQDVLRDLLNDPFARRVFEDIYSELAKKEKKEEPRAETKTETHHAEASFKRPEAHQKEQPKKSKAVPLKERGPEKGVAGFLKNLARKQIDEEIHLTFPAAKVSPGKKIPLTVSYGLKNETQTVEVVIPPNFVAGKPMRLKGLGKRIGPWQGDLYLTIHTF